MTNEYDSGVYPAEVATAGDVNGDGFDDVMVAAPNYWEEQSEWGEGGVVLYLGTMGGLTLEPAWSVQSNNGSAHLGWSLTTLGDVNLDGYDDIALGAPSYTETIEYAGAVVVFSGRPGAKPAAP
jgi:hypothetical protein